MKRIHGLLAFIGIGCAGLTACVGGSRKPEPPLVGVWSVQYEDVSAVILRKPNGAYAEKRGYWVGRPATLVDATGSWQLSGQSYLLDSRWKAQPAKGLVRPKASKAPIALRVLKIRQDEFRYRTREGGLVVEKKIDQASDSNFRRATRGL